MFPGWLYNHEMKGNRLISCPCPSKKKYGLQRPLSPSPPASYAAIWLWSLPHDVHRNIRLVLNILIMTPAATDGRLAIHQAAHWDLYSSTHPTDIYWISTMWQNWSRFHGTVWIKQCSCCPRTFQEEQREKRQINMKQTRWWLRLQIRKWNKGPESDHVKCAVLTKPTRNTAEAQKHVQLIASVQQARRCTLGIQVSKREVVQWTSEIWAVPAIWKGVQESRILLWIGYFQDVRVILWVGILVILI